MIPYTPTSAASVASNPSQGATPSTSARAGFTPFTSGQTVPNPAQTPTPETVNPRQAFTPSNIAKLPGQLYNAITSFLPGKQIGTAIGNSLAGPVGAIQPLLQGDPQLALDTLKVGASQGAQANSTMVGKVAGDTAQAIALPVSLALGGGTGSSVAARVGTAALKYGTVGALGTGGNTAANGGNVAQTATAAGEGFVAGAAGGAIGQGLGEGLSALYAPKAPATLQDSLDMTQPTLNKKGSIAALENSGRPGGATNKGPLGTIAVQPSPRDIQIAQTVQPLVEKGDPVGTIANINGQIEDIAQNQIRPALQANPSSFNLKTLNAYIRDNTQVPNYIKADPVLQRTYDLTRDAMMEEAAQQPKTLEGLWDARINFDQVAARQGVGLDPTSPQASVIKQAVLDTRRAVNDFIVENHPDGQAAFGQPMKLLNNLYTARTNIATANYKNLGTNAITRWIKANPGKAKLLEYGVGALGLGAAFGEGQHIITAL